MRYAGGVARFSLSVYNRVMHTLARIRGPGRKNLSGIADCRILRVFRTMHLAGNCPVNGFCASVYAGWSEFCTGILADSIFHRFEKWPTVSHIDLITFESSAYIISYTRIWSS
jgi:hypothetical protein